MMIKRQPERRVLHHSRRAAADARARRGTLIYVASVSGVVDLGISPGMRHAMPFVLSSTRDMASRKG